MSTDNKKYPELPTLTVIPAQPGFWLLELEASAEDDPDRPRPDAVVRKPIIGWQVHVFLPPGGRDPDRDAVTVPAPITPSGEPGEMPWAILYPDGQVEEPGDGYANEQVWLRLSWPMAVQRARSEEAKRR